MSRTFYNGTDVELLNGSAAFSELINADPAAYGLQSLQCTDFAVLNSAYASAYNAATAPGTRTTVAVAEKNTARADLVASARLLSNIIDSTLTVTEAMKIELGIPPRAGMTRVPVPSTVPLIGVVSVVSRTVKLRLRDSVGLGRGLPPGVRSATIFSFVGETRPGDLKLWTYEGAVTKTTNDITFPDSVANGSQAWIVARWSNNRAESGPIGVPVSVIVQGGGLSRAA